VLGAYLLAGQRHKVRQLSERQQHLHNGALDAHPFHTLDQVVRQVFLPDHSEVGSVRVGVGENYACLEMAAVGEVDAPRGPVPDVYPGDLRVGQDLDTRLSGRGGYGPGDGAHAAADKAPGALVPAGLAEDVVVLDVGGAGGAGAGVRPDHAAHAQHRL
jgi:hypothetical protein